MNYVTQGKSVFFMGKRLFFFKLLNWFDNGPHNWGYGIFQIGTRHLFFIGSDGVSIFFIPKLRHG